MPSRGRLVTTINQMLKCQIAKEIALIEDGRSFGQMSVKIS